MGKWGSGAGSKLRLGEVEITAAAIAGYGRLLAALGRGVILHPCGDGGVICEDRTFRPRPAMWRIRPDGELLADTRYSFAARNFVAVPLPDGV